MHLLLGSVACGRSHDGDQANTIKANSKLLNQATLVKAMLKEVPQVHLEANEIIEVSTTRCFSLYRSLRYMSMRAERREFSDLVKHLVLIEQNTSHYRLAVMFMYPTPKYQTIS